MVGRPLSTEERGILEIIQQLYGSLNSQDKVIFTDRGEAVLFVKDASGGTPLVANLTNLARWRADGTIPSDEALVKDWLKVESA